MTVPTATVPTCKLLVVDCIGRNGIRSDEPEEADQADQAEHAEWRHVGLESLKKINHKARSFCNNKYGGYFCGPVANLTKTLRSLIKTLEL